MKVGRVLASVAAIAATTGVMVANAAGPAAAHDDTQRVSGSCSRSSDYTMKLSDAGAQLRLQRLHFFIDGDKGKNRVWTVTVYKDGDRIYRTTRDTNSRGNLTVDRVFTADDDADIRVYAKAGYGESCRRTTALDGTRSTQKVTGSCSGSSDYTITLSDLGYEKRQQRLHFFIDANKGNDRTWTISVYKDGDRIYRTTRNTDSHGNITVNRDFFADDDADIRVYAKAGYGEHCNRITSLD